MGKKLVKIYFTPRNPEDLLFRGYLYITLNGQYAVAKIELGVSKHVNLNYIRNFQINQQFKKDSSTHYYLAESETSAFFSPLPKSPGLFGERKDLPFFIFQILYYPITSFTGLQWIACREMQISHPFFGRITGPCHSVRLNRKHIRMQTAF